MGVHNPALGNGGFGGLPERNVASRHGSFGGVAALLLARCRWTTCDLIGLQSLRLVASVNCGGRNQPLWWNSASTGSSQPCPWGRPAFPCKHSAVWLRPACDLGDEAKRTTSQRSTDSDTDRLLRDPGNGRGGEESTERAFGDGVSRADYGTLVRTCDLRRFGLSGSPGPSTSTTRA
jgi:hypothetical protein